eukprot:1154872-Pelagomonas_calceolata.AAC.3
MTAPAQQQTTHANAGSAADSACFCLCDQNLRHSQGLGSGNPSHCVHQAGHLAQACRASWHGRKGKKRVT